MATETFPMTPAGFRKLRDELRRIKEVDRPENVEEIATARDHGDISENAEYAAAKERQSNLDARMRYLEFRMAKAQVIDPPTIRSERVGFGATVTLIDLENDERVVYALVGEDESNVDRGHISIVSPLARALIGKAVGDECSVQLPRGTREFEVVGIEYKALE
jgi:transcription elongation factor GreA